MQFGVREICDVVLKAKAMQKVGNKIFYKHEPVIYFDTLKTSTMEGAATTVYAQGGAGNPRLIAWEGERTITFTMEDALISPEGFMILSGAGLIEGSDATDGEKIKQHLTETVDKKDIKLGTDGALEMTIPVSKNAYIPDTKEHYVYVMLMKDGQIVSEPLIALTGAKATEDTDATVTVKASAGYAIDVKFNGAADDTDVVDFDSVMIDYYTEVGAGAKQIEITADKFGGNYYLEASTLFRNTAGVDMPAEFIIPNCKIQSNFTFTMASSGDPSTFTFTMDAFPDYTRFDRSKKVLSAIQIIDAGSEQDKVRTSTLHDKAHEEYFN